MTDDSNDAQRTAFQSHYAVDVNGGFEFDGGRLASLKAKLEREPRILSKKAGRDSCSIFRVPKNLIEVNGKQYHPHMVSIGPFHHHYRMKQQQNELEMMQEHKHHYLFQLLCRTQLSLEYLFENVAPLENRARECYSEEIELDSHDFVEIMVVDGCFIIELVRKIGKFPVMFEHDDPIATMSWMMPILIRDLLRLENQLPFFVLQKLFDLTSSSTSALSSSPSLWDLCFDFFGYEEAVYRPPSVVERMRGYQARHLLDLLRSSFIPREIETRNRDLVGHTTPSHIIHCVSKLRKAGIMIRPPARKSRDQEAETFLAVKFEKWGVLHMPMVTIDDFMTSFFANCVAYELCQKSCTTYFTTYTTLLDCLVNTGKDVEYLCDKNIIENYYGTESEVAQFLNNLGKDTAFDVDRCYLGDVFNQVNRYYENNWHVHWASFKYTYFNTPWSFISALAAFILLILSVFQTLYTILSYLQSKKN